MRIVFEVKLDGNHENCERIQNANGRRRIERKREKVENEPRAAMQEKRKAGDSRNMENGN